MLTEKELQKNCNSTTPSPDRNGNPYCFLFQKNNKIVMIGEKKTETALSYFHRDNYKQIIYILQFGYETIFNINYIQMRHTKVKDFTKQHKKTLHEVKRMGENF
jgi:hypothetical protein